MLNAKILTVRYGAYTAVSRLSFTLEEGQWLMLVGPNGAGKSSLISAIAQCVPYEGTIRLEGKNLRDFRPAELARKIGVLSQQHTVSYGYTVEEIVSLGRYAHQHWLLGRRDEKGTDAIEQALEKTGMTALRNKSLLELSGGEVQRAFLAQVFAQEPEILLLDEPTNYLDIQSVRWLENFLLDFPNTVIVVSHDRHFLNKVCTHICDIDFGKIQMYVGNYDFWYESSQLIQRMLKDQNRKNEEKIKELQEFIQRFSANASKSKQATSRKRALEKIQLDEIRPSSRKYPYIDFRPEREIGNDVLFVEGISKTIDGVKVLDNISFTVNHDDKIAFVGGNELAKTTMFKILAGELEPDEGSYKWGVTTSQSYFPKDNTTIFDTDELIVDWLTQYSEIKDATYVRGFLGRMLFAGEDGVKKMRVLSGGEKVRVLLSRMMIMGSNVLMFDEPTDHLDMESITALNNGMIKFPGVILFACRDHQVVQTTANRIIEFLPNGSMIDKITTYDEYLASDEMARKRQTYSVQTEEED